ncbi:MAG: hypothetical protein A2538_00865 [Candidatus Magasanikbacteria bacterium RIFOXYD2_FULL_41_14]|uniref:Uncharacterized protein n=1 Tax=Candidatus Magasanikbacteria bacterium RIFOXYD2_FULL_41_14 TaxID=1798709 RepID=A0A1F6PEC6_9BACT|nr:MAG: hypothetical protein A2538_00865 [Candidatus Magasanikbacteria bacterium RIFOXYD2_FULL_41_14]
MRRIAALWGRGLSPALQGATLGRVVAESLCRATKVWGQKGPPPEKFAKSPNARDAHARSGDGGEVLLEVLLPHVHPPPPSFLPYILKRL